ncbi:MAG: magnesium transporter [Acidobacteriota bacterium]
MSQPVDSLRERLAGALELRLRSRHPEAVAEALGELPDRELDAVLVGMANEDPAFAAEVLSLLGPHDVRRFLGFEDDTRIGQLLGHLAPDDAIWVLELLPDQRVETVLAAMEDPDDGVRERLAFPEDSAGRLMSDEFLALSAHETADDAIAALREAGEDVTIVYVYLVDDDRRLTGVVSLRRLLRVPPATPLHELTPRDLLSVRVDDDQEDVARRFSQYDLVCVPVVDAAGVLAGVITHDDILDVLREEATEDMLQMAGTTAEDAQGHSVLRSAWLRSPWLLFALVGGLVSARLLAAKEASLGSAFVALAVFVPVIVGMGGNVGTQAATIVVRGLATGRIRSHDSLRVIWSELRTALLIGLGYGTLLALAAGLLMGQPPVASAVIGSSLAVSVLVASAVGTVLPIVFQALDVDPAVATGPLVTTSIDVLGILAYLSLAAWLLLP